MFVFFPLYSFELEEGDSDEEENDTTLDQTAEKGDKV